MASFIAALLAPVAGVLLYVWLHSRPSTIRAIDKAVLWILPVLIALQILLHSWPELHIGALIAVLSGAGALYVIEKISRSLARHTDDLAIFLGVFSMAVHALLEGGALIPAAANAPFALAVILHRVAVGLLIWWLLEPRHGVGVATAGVGAILVATTIGFAAGTEILPDGHAAIELYQAFVAGSLLHVVFHQGRRDHRHD
ncbi:MAG: hypothetical protein OXI39_06630 [Gemmatimonadota bacterium]|uniref:hypothetical protein n=1 Tax=Candidatus Palauibacter scopulicola TaxID=3056741 RepID=UPI0023904856|nr:hypothetical protein [Candidatus Palauibacter scopulicola]MDE2662659.1 hypothetical protein [Candidatus Palauibacter scopulicola]